VADLALLDPARLADVDQLDPLAPQVADLLVADLITDAAPVVLAEPAQDRHRHREPQVLVLGDPALVGQVEVGQRQGVDRHAPGLAVGRIAGLLGDVAHQRIGPQRANPGRLIGPEVVAGDVI
jgi:hypothetical protein